MTNARLKSRPKLYAMYVLTLGVNLAFNLVATPRLPLLRDSLVTMAVVTIVTTIVISKLAIWLLSIKGDREALTDDEIAARIVARLFVQTHDFLCREDFLCKAVRTGFAHKVPKSVYGVCTLCAD